MIIIFLNIIVGDSPRGDEAHQEKVEKWGIAKTFALKKISFKLLKRFNENYQMHETTACSNCFAL